MQKNRYYTPKIEELHVGFEYEVFKTIPNKKYINDKGVFVIPGFKTYSDEYFEELHSNDKYWKDRKWVKKQVNKNTVWELSDSFDIQKYKPLDINNIYRVKCLDGEDIESIGFIKDQELKVDTTTIYYSDLKNDKGNEISLFYNKVLNWVMIYEGKCGGRLTLDGDQYPFGGTLFAGNIKNKSELVKVLKMLRVK